MTTSVTHLCHLETDAGGVKWHVLAFHGREALGEPFRFTLFVMPHPAGDLIKLGEQLLGEPARVLWDPDGDDHRVLHGIVEEAESRGDALEVVVAARIGALADIVDHRIFLDQTALEIASQILDEHQFTVDPRCQRTPPKRKQCVQQFESCLGFVTRILAEEGIEWLCDPDKKDGIIFCDNPQGFSALSAGPFETRESSDLSQDVERLVVLDPTIGHRAVSEKVTLRDYNFETPSVNLTADRSEGPGKLEHYEYRGRYPDPTIGRDQARLRLEMYRRDRLRLTANTGHLGLRAGSILEIKGGVSTEADGKWLLTEIEIETEGAESEEAEAYSIRFSAVPSTTPWRPERVAQPKVPGLQTMTVTGGSGDEIHTEELGRIKAHFRWDRKRPLDDTASTWIRVIQPATSGAFFLPRIGWEIAAGFWNGSMDDPFVVGRLYNGTAPPPNGLPGDKIVSAFGTLTTPGGGTANLVQFNDTAGNEGMNFNASYDFNERTENDKVTEITANETNQVGVNRDVIVGLVHTIGVTGNQTYTIGVNRSVSVEKNKDIQASAESISVGGARIFDIGGDNQTQCSGLARVVGAAKAVVAIDKVSVLATGGAVRVIGGAWAQVAAKDVGVTVGGAATTTVAGVKAIKAAGFHLKARGLTETYASRKEKAQKIVQNAKGAATFTVDGNCAAKGSKVVVWAKDKIEIKADGVTITMTPSKVSISGKYKSSQTSVDDSTESYD